MAGAFIDSLFISVILNSFLISAIPALADDGELVT